MNKNTTAGGDKATSEQAVKLFAHDHYGLSQQSRNNIVQKIEHPIPSNYLLIYQGFKKQRRNVQSIDSLHAACAVRNGLHNNSA